MVAENNLEAWEEVIAKLVRLNEEKNLFEVRSSSNPEEWYDIDLTHGKCNCIGFSFRGRCKHLKLAKEFGERKGVSQKVQTEKTVMGSHSESVANNCNRQQAGQRRQRKRQQLIWPRWISQNLRSF